MNAQVETQADCLGEIRIQNSLSTISFDLTSAPNSDSPGGTITDDTSVNVDIGGVNVTSETIASGNETFTLVEVSNAESNEEIEIVVSNNSNANVSFNNLGVTTDVLENSPLDDLSELAPSTLGPFASYDSRTGRIDFQGLNQLDTSHPSIAVLLESSLSSFRFCTVEGGDANLFVPGNRKRFTNAEHDFLLWYYDDLSLLPDTLDVGNVIEPGTPAQALNFLYWTSDLEFTYPFDRQAASIGPVVVVPEPSGILLIAIAVFPECAASRRLWALV